MRLAGNYAYDAILLDLLMPGIGGFEVLREIRRASPNIATPVVIVSVLADQATKDRCLRAGANAYLVKPVERNALVADGKGADGLPQHAEDTRKVNMPEIRIENVEALGKPLGQYSHMTRVKGATETLYIAGMLAPGDDFDAQCSGVFRQIETALKSAGAGWGSVVQFTTYLVHSQDIPKFMAWRLREFPKLFPDGKYPPNTLLIIDRLVQEQFLVEVQAIAAL